jgi:hypothetical protein
MRAAEMTSDIASKCEGWLIDIGSKLTDGKTGKTAEADVFRVKEDREVWCYECKAHRRPWSSISRGMALGPVSRRSAGQAGASPDIAKAPQQSPHFA